MKRIAAVILALAASALVVPAAANASCSVVGEVVRVYDTAASTAAYIKTAGLASYYYYFVTTDGDLQDTLLSCENSRHRCQIVGNAAACPTSGSVRYGGVVDIVIISP